METLKSILPSDCKPIVVSDAGFRVPWFKLVESLGWDYVGRVRNKTLCRKLNQETRCLTREFYKIATTRVKNLGPFLLTKRAEFNSRLVIIKKKRKGRKNLLANKSSPRLNSYSLECAKRESEPWLLATSLNKPATKIVKIYATRMQIEESFRDLKTGLNMNNSNTRRIDRMQVLLAIAAISQYFLYVLGIAVKLQNGHFQYQANSLKTRNVLSNHFIGLRAFKDRRFKLLKKQWNSAIIELKKLIAEPKAYV